MTECLDEESILSFCRGTMAPEKRPPAEAHIAECEECRVLVSAVLRSSFVDPSERLPASRPPAELEAEAGAGAAKEPDVSVEPTTPGDGGGGDGSGRVSTTGGGASSSPMTLERPKNGGRRIALVIVALLAVTVLLGVVASIALR